MPVKIEHRLGVAASAEEVWRAIADLSMWPSWNPLYSRLEGVLRIGSVLDIEATLPGQKPRAVRAVVTDWVPNEQIIWRVSALGGLVNSLRYVEIEALSTTGCIFANGEVFSGPLGPAVARRFRNSICAGFAAMGEAVRERAVSARAGGAFSQ